MKKQLFIMLLLCVAPYAEGKSKNTTLCDYFKAALHAITKRGIMTPTLELAVLTPCATNQVKYLSKKENANLNQWQSSILGSMAANNLIESIILANDEGWPVEQITADIILQFVNGGITESVTQFILSQASKRKYDTSIAEHVIRGVINYAYRLGLVKLDKKLSEDDLKANFEDFEDLD